MDVELPCCDLSNKVGESRKHGRVVVLFH